MLATRTREETRAWFEAEGLTVTAWAQQHGFSAAVVYALLTGRVRGRRGNAHRAAIALGLKLPTIKFGMPAGQLTLSADTAPQKGATT